MIAVKAVSAIFNLSPTYVLTVATSGSGSVGSSPAGVSCGSTCVATFSSGAVVMLTQAAGSGYIFSGWTGACSGTGSCSVSMTAAKAVGATFTATSMPVPVPVPAPTAPGLAACVPSGLGTDYQVGPNAGQLSSLDQVPWENLTAGDTVRVFYRAAPYPGKFLLTANGTTSAPVRICGVKGSGGERPVITGANATTRRGLVYGSAYAAPIQESRSVIMIKGTLTWTHYPSNIQIDGLAIRAAHPNYQFTDSAGVSQTYTDFGGCIWIDRGQNITIADNEISDCTNGVFSKSTDDGDFAVSKNLRIASNYIHGNGVVGDVHQHNSYVQSVGVVYEFNRYGALRGGALGNGIKDRSVGAVVRFNRIEEGAHAIDLVEAEDFPATATANPAYRTTFVYGNQIVKSGDSGSFIHYGGDHYGSTPGAAWGEPIFRKGTLYFFNNTIYATGSGAVLFQLATTEEKAEVWNNVFVFASSVAYPSMRSNTDIGASWTAGGIVNLGRNWISAGWADSDPDHPIPGQLNGSANMISGTTAPISLTTLVPVAGSAIVDASQAPPAAASAYALTYQLGADFLPTARTVNGTASDLGAVER